MQEAAETLEGGRRVEAERKQSASESVMRSNMARQCDDQNDRGQRDGYGEEGSEGEEGGGGGRETETKQAVRRET